FSCLAHLSVALLLYRSFFHCSSALFDLHSFPTRRSSDLLRNSEIFAATSSVRFSRIRLRSKSRSLYSRSSISCPYLSVCPSSGLDRKSTRLNSSHVAISYAVFCLKKKKYQTYLTYTYIHT